MYPNRKELKDLFIELESIKDKSTDDYFYKYMKIVYSFGKERRLTQKGIEKCEELYQMWKKDGILEREDILVLGFLLSDICVLEASDEKINDLVTIYNQTMMKYNPDFDYMNQFALVTLLEKGYSEVNKDYMPEIEEMYLRDLVLPDEEQVEMISTGKMPMDDIKKCPYCSKDFSNEEPDVLFKHVKDTHEKK